MKGSLKLVIGAILAVGLAYGAWQASLVLRIGCGGAAKMVCSNHFLSGRQLPEMERHELSILPPGIFSVSIGDQSATASTLFGLSRTARFRGPLIGCALDSNEEELRHRLDGLEDITYTQKALGGAAKWPAGYEMDEAAQTKAKAAFDMTKLADSVHSQFTNSSLHTRAVLVAYDGQIVHEEYAEEEEEGHFDESVVQLGWSMTKSLLSTLIGLRIGEGRMALSQKVECPEWPESDKRQAITVKDLLQMSSGLEFEENYGLVNDPASMLFIGSSTPEYAAKKPLVAPVGSRWSYSSGSTNLLARKLRESFGSDEEYWKYPREALFGPIGMDSAVMEVDSIGTLVGSSFSYATPRDWLKYGLLYLNEGKWPYGSSDAEQVLPEGWTQQTGSAAPASHGLYGLHWWLGGSDTDPESVLPKFRWQLDLPEGTMMALGYDEQMVMVVPSRKLVVVRLGWTPRAVAWNKGQFVKDVLDSLL